MSKRGGGNTPSGEEDLQAVVDSMHQAMDDILLNPTVVERIGPWPTVSLAFGITTPDARRFLSTCDIVVKMVSVILRESGAPDEREPPNQQRLRHSIHWPEPTPLRPLTAFASRALASQIFAN